MHRPLAWQLSWQLVISLDLSIADDPSSLSLMYILAVVLLLSVVLLPLHLLHHLLHAQGLPFVLTVHLPFNLLLQLLHRHSGIIFEHFFDLGHLIPKVYKSVIFNDMLFFLADVKHKVFDRHLAHFRRVVHLAVLQDSRHLRLQVFNVKQNVVL